MNGADAAMVLGVAATAAIAIGLVRGDPAFLAAGGFLCLVALIVELVRSDTPAEQAWYRNHQARKGRRR